MNHSHRKMLLPIDWSKSILRLVFVATFAITMLPASALVAQQSKLPPEIGEPDTTFVGQADASVIDMLRKELPKPDANAAETVLENNLRQTKEILGGETIWFTANWPRIPTTVTISVDDADGTRVSRLSKLWNLRSNKLVVNEICTVSLKSITKPEKPNENESENDWQKILAHAPKGPVRFAMQPPTHFYRTLAELLNELPDYLGGGPVTLLTEGALSANVSLDPATRSIDGFIQSKSNEAATRLKDHLPTLLTSAIGSIADESNRSVAKTLLRIAKETTFSVQQDRVLIQFKPKDAAAGAELAKQAIDTIIAPVARQSQSEKLRSAALGIHNYQSAYSYFPPPVDSRGPDGPTGLSWRVHILPFLGEVELWKKFKLDEPWNSPANKKLLPEMPAIYSQFSSQLMMPVDGPKGMTMMLAPAGENTILGAPKRVTFGNISDGSSNTVLLVIVKDSLAVPWTAPQDYQFDPKDPAAGLLFVDGKTPVVMGDGSTPTAARDNQWLHLFEMNDGNVVQFRE